MPHLSEKIRARKLARNHIRTTAHDGRRLPPLAALEKLSVLLDAALAIPGTRWRIGIDGLLGLIPGVGDTLGAAFSSYIIYAAARQGAPKRTLFKMVCNVFVEAIVGLIPIVWDVFDIAWQANIRNMELLRAEPQFIVRSARSSRQVASLFAAAAGISVVLLFVLSLLLLQSLYRLISG